MKIMLKSNKEATIYMNGKPPFSLYSANGQVLNMLNEFLAPVDQSNFNTLSDYNVALKNSLEDTQVLNIDVLKAS